MSRRRKANKREILPDPKFGDLILSKFMACLMIDGKKYSAEKIVYGAFDRIKDKSDIGYLVLASSNRGESPGELVEFISKSGFSIPVVVIPGDINNDNIDKLVGIK